MPVCRARVRKVVVMFWLEFFGAWVVPLSAVLVVLYFVEKRANR